MASRWGLTFRPLARLMALRGRRTRRTLRIFTTEMAEDLNNENKYSVSLKAKYSWKKHTETGLDLAKGKHVCVCSYLLDAKWDEGNSHHQQVQEVEVVPTECSFMEEGSVCRHLRRGQGKSEEQMAKKKTHISSNAHWTHTNKELCSRFTLQRTQTHRRYTHVKQEKHHAHTQHSPPCTRAHVSTLF